MKKKPGKYLRFYYESMRTGMMPIFEDGCYGGLCLPLDNYYNRDEFFKLITPDKESGYWGYRGEEDYPDEAKNTEYAEKIKREFTPLRQTIVLFLAAMNSEL